MIPFDLSVPYEVALLASETIDNKCVPCTTNKIGRDGGEGEGGGEVERGGGGGDSHCCYSFVFSIVVILLSFIYVEILF